MTTHETFRLGERDCEELQQIAAGNCQGFSYDQMVRYLKRAKWTPGKKPKGSHRVWRRKGLRRIVLVDRNPLKPIYVRETVNRLREEHCP